MIGKSMRWERFSMKVNTDSRKVNTDSRKWGKSVHVQQESVFTFSRNGCSHWAGMGVQLQREYAHPLNAEKLKLFLAAATSPVVEKFGCWPGMLKNNGRRREGGLKNAKSDHL